MPRLNRLDQVLFPVKEHPVFAYVKDSSGERHLSIPDKKAIVNVNNNRVLGVVGRGYRLITNREALNWAYKCCASVFPATKPTEWQVESTDAPSTAGYCHIDLCHNSTALDFAFVRPEQRPEAFGPFIRVTNSYNGLRALSFDIGFHRKICRNGMIVPQSVIRFSFNHLQRDIGENIRFEIAHDKLNQVRTSISRYFEILQNCKISRVHFDSLVMNALSLKRPEPWNPKSRAGTEWQVLTSGLSKTNDRYANDLGENAYAVFNSMTDFASHPPSNRCVYRDRHSFQKLAGAWLAAFSDQCSKADFSIERYLENAGSAQNSKIDVFLN